MGEVVKKAIITVKKGAKGYIGTVQDDFRGTLEYGANTLEELFSAIFNGYLSIEAEGFHKIFSPGDYVTEIKGELKIYFYKEE